MTVHDPSFCVVSGAQVRQVLAGSEAAVIDLVRTTYLAHAAGQALNPPSYFLTFPTRPRDRIIALPAALTGDEPVSGLKWIGSYPANIEHDLPRASAVTILNDFETGYPFACVESSVISASRTAASAALGATVLSEGRDRPRRLGLVGAGLINRYVHRYLQAAGWHFEEVVVHDLVADRAKAFCGLLGQRGEVTTRTGTLEEAVGTDLVCFATVAGEPYVTDPQWFDHHPVVLHVSLRDLSPEVILSGQNVVDDVEHVLKAKTSVHLVEQQVGHRDFIDGTLADVVEGRVVPERSQTIFFSPFGLGVLDLALARFIVQQVSAAGEAYVIPDFFADLRRLDPS